MFSVRSGSAWLPNLDCAAVPVAGGNQFGPGPGTLQKAQEDLSSLQLLHLYISPLTPTLNYLFFYLSLIKYGGRSRGSCLFFLSFEIGTLIAHHDAQVIDNGSGMCKAGCRFSA